MNRRRPWPRPHSFPFSTIDPNAAQGQRLCAAFFAQLAPPGSLIGVQRLHCNSDSIQLRAVADGDDSELYRPNTETLASRFITFDGRAVVPRKPKLIAAAAVLAVGLGLAWPWRRGDSVPASVLPISTPSSSFGSVAAPFVERTPASAPTTVSATTIGLAGTPPSSELASASSLPQAVTVAKQVQVEPGQFALSGIEPPEALSAAARERTYIVQEGDSLERLAQRYLGDEGRAIELFDLNRQVLENPHLLPIGAELKIPIGVDSVGATNAE